MADDGPQPIRIVRPAHDVILAASVAHHRDVTKRGERDAGPSRQMTDPMTDFG